MPGLRGVSRRPPQKRRPDKAFMPPSGTTAGMELEVSSPAALRLPGLRGVSRTPPQKRRPDKAFMPPSGTTAGAAPDRPAALRLRGPTGGYPARLLRNVGRIRHLCRHPALPPVRRLTARRRCACAGLGGIPQASSET
ncbi:hypothetical protein C2767_24640 [Klebsiella quasipneumoniae]|nr:hypothetical protein DP204_24790 [Klebsiella quasipneumoniae subsp. quasipneumoniae]QEY80574.1 hypothetical protein C2767_24640 [Klebsiella quasipneumoniae]